MAIHKLDCLGNSLEGTADLHMYIEGPKGPFVEGPKDNPKGKNEKPKGCKNIKMIRMVSSQSKLSVFTNSETVYRYISREVCKKN